jgi:hypothetical protein
MLHSPHAEDVEEAVAAAAGFIAECSSMGRLHAMIQSEETAARFGVATKDLQLALAGLVPLRDSLPPDVSEDIDAVQRQLEGVHLWGGACDQALSWQLLQRLTLLHVQGRDVAQAAALLEEAIQRAGGLSSGMVQHGTVCTVVQAPWQAHSAQSPP